MNEFFLRIKPLLSEEEFVIFQNEYKKPFFRGVRVNTLKCSVEKFTSLLQNEGINLTPTPFCEEGFYIEENTPLSGKHPLHHAGAIYFQEPSAMSAASVLCAQKGDKVLDLCAAPGGKSTQLAAALGGEGLLWSNEYVRSRANILVSNLERCGVSNGVVSSCEPEVLCTSLEGFFDKVLVDAPCSGEGMFRRDKEAREEWSPEHSDSCAVRQLKILNSAKKALKAEGVLVYSTCTFSYEENEGVIEKFLKENPDFELADAGETFGRRTLGSLACRIFPMDGGEGHFVAKLRKKSGKEECCRGGLLRAKAAGQKKIPDFVKDFFTDTFETVDFEDRLSLIGDKVYILPEFCPELSGLGVVRAGVLAGVVKKNYFEPAHALYMASDINNLKQVVNLKLYDIRTQKFLHGEEIAVEESIKGYTGVALEGIITGFGKVSSGMLKNKYPKGLRNL
ncbi:MAG: RsmB/NOP family class I SAM-dependent RNA methyltransferase [Ruminococcus sp.]